VARTARAALQNLRNRLGQLASRINTGVTNFVEKLE
jgi:hypothetical protein